MKTLLYAAIFRRPRSYEVCMFMVGEKWRFLRTEASDSEADSNCLRLRLDYLTEQDLMQDNSKPILYDFAYINDIQGTNVIARVFSAKLKGEIRTPTTRLNQIAWTCKPEDYQISPIEQKIAALLRNERYLPALSNG